MDSWIQKVISKWKSEGVKLGSPAAISDIEKIESILNFKFPDEFKEFYQICNGFMGLHWQEHMFTLWPLEMIIEEHNTYQNKNFIWFCDFLLASHFIGFNKNRPGIFKEYGNVEDGEQIASSFEEIVMMINSNADAIY